MTGETRMLKSFRKLEVQEVSLNDSKILECSLLHTMASSGDPSDAATSSVADSRLRPETFQPTLQAFSFCLCETECSACLPIFCALPSPPLSGK